MTAVVQNEVRVRKQRQSGEACMTDLKGKVAVVTGGGSGIGRGLAMALAKEGSPVVIADIMEESGAAVAAEITQAGGHSIAIHCDVSDRASVRQMKSQSSQAFGHVSLLFANAGVTLFKPFTDMTDDEIDWVIQVNLMGVFNCLQAFLPDMIEARSGHVFATSSTSGLLCPFLTDHAPYVAAKSGVIGLMLTMRNELEQFGIGSTVLCPGAVATRITDSLKYRPDRFGGPSEAPVTLPRGESSQKQRPPEEVARMVLLAVRENRPIVVTDASHKELFRQGYAAPVLFAYDAAAAFDGRNVR